MPNHNILMQAKSQELHRMHHALAFPQLDISFKACSKSQGSHFHLLAIVIY